ncbi:MAG: hypothetical protein KTU85_06345 [Acidimicrobiia bacterium]|nr:hypothetical protein [Acidimicrobiia bacterium]
MPESNIKPFPLPIGTMFLRGLRGYTANFFPLTLAALATFAVYSVLGIPSVLARQSDNTIRYLTFNIAGSILGGTAAYPWFCYALNASRSEPIDLAAPFRDWSRFIDQLVCSLWFWAALILGLQYLWGLPSLLVVVFYAFFGFVVADKATEGPLRALGTSVRLGDKRRIGILALVGMFLLFNLIGLLPVGFAVNPLTIAITVLTLSMTTNVTMVAWAALYDVLNDLLQANPPPPPRRRRPPKRQPRKNWRKPPGKQ